MQRKRKVLVTAWINQEDADYLETLMKKSGSSRSSYLCYVIESYVANGRDAERIAAGGSK